jgi:indolepyruvate decarboxylase
MQLSNFLIERLVNAGVKHVFGVPGDHIQEFYHELWKCEEIEIITNTDEAHSAFAADAYARINGIGCVVATYNVGTSKIINAVQCAYAERSPLVVIAGCPGAKDYWMIGSQKAMFDKITCASVVLDNPVTSGYLIDSAFEAMRHYKRPIYIELPRDMVKKSLSYDVYKQGTPIGPGSNASELGESIEEVEAWIKNAKRPVIVAGVEVARCGLSDQLVKFAERNSIHVAATMLSKSVMNERHPLFAGVYCGPISKDNVRETVEQADCLILLGVLANDAIMCHLPMNAQNGLTVNACIEDLQVRNHRYPHVQFVDFCKTLFKKDFGRAATQPIRATVKLAPFQPEKNRAITTARLFEKINTVLDENIAIVCDIGDCMYGASDLVVHNSHRFLCPSFYMSMGIAVPGAIAAQLASPTTRPIVVVGDGAAQMSLAELSTAARRGLTPIVLVINNGGYLTERMTLDGDYNNIQPWKYHKVTDLIGSGLGFEVKDEVSMDQAIDTALESNELCVINVHVDPKGMSPGLKKMMELSKK